MNEKTIKVLIPFLTLGLIVFAVFLVQQSAQLKSLQEQLVEQGAQIDKSQRR